MQTFCNDDWSTILYSLLKVFKIFTKQSFFKLFSNNILTECLRWKNSKFSEDKKLSIFTLPPTVTSSRPGIRPLAVVTELSACYRRKQKGWIISVSLQETALVVSELTSLLYGIWRFSPHKTNLQTVSGSYFLLEYRNYWVCVRFKAGGECYSLRAFVLLWNVV